ncbi:MAG: DUF371 domain-containing protein [Candidatus Verstraetearchaeota archaeon]|nr:DUF371 domain-containing protein [Candidatus Verstraetearchaeota archaeon]
MVTMARFTFYARGDPRITALHPTTLEVTREEVKSGYGDCIVATSSEVGLRELPEELKRAARSGGAEMVLIIEAGGLVERVRGTGHSSLTFTNESEMVVRKSRYVCGRTLMINSDKAAIDLDRELVEQLKKQSTRVKITLFVGEE